MRTGPNKLHSAVYQGKKKPPSPPMQANMQDQAMARLKRQCPCDCSDETGLMLVLLMHCLCRLGTKYLHLARLGPRLSRLDGPAMEGAWR